MTTMPNLTTNPNDMTTKNLTRAVTDTDNGECSSLSSGSASSRSIVGLSIGGVNDFDANTDWNRFQLHMNELDQGTRDIIDGLRAQIQGMRGVQRATEVKYKRMQDAYLKRKKNGARALLKAMESNDVENVQKITNFVDTVLVKVEFILKDGWDVWSGDEDSFPQKCIARSGVVVPEDQSAERYWEEFMSTKIHHCLGRKRDNVLQRIKNKWHSKWFHYVVYYLGIEFPV